MDTRERMLEAALGLLRAEDPEALTLARVAAAAGVTERTLYRHFGSREELLAAVWARINASLGPQPAPETPEGLVAQPRELFPRFDAQAQLVRVLLTTPQGRELRLASNRARRARVRAAVRAARPGLEDPDLTRLCAVVQLLGSAVAWNAMHDYWALDGREAAAAASAAIARLLREEETRC